MKTTIKNNPLTTIFIIISVISEVWNILKENAEIFGISANTVSKITLIISLIMVAYNVIKTKNTSQSFKSSRTPQTQQKSKFWTIAFTTIAVLSESWALIQPQAEILGFNTKTLVLIPVLLAIIKLAFDKYNLTFNEHES